MANAAQSPFRTSTEPVSVAVIGAGLIGRRHIEAIAASTGAVLDCIVDPAQAAKAIAKASGVPLFETLDAALRRDTVEAAILATPNQHHVEGALACIAAGRPVLVEKPLASNVADARAIVAAGREANLPVLTGHHRRYNPIIAKAREIIARGDLGTLVSLQATTWFHKPDDYFDRAWRREKGAGPIYINLIHDIDLMQHFAGPVSDVYAMQSSTARGHEVEDTAVVSLRFASGALGTINLSDTISAPWSWELTSGENPAYPVTNQTAYVIGGTQGSLAIPNLAVWTHDGAQSWWQPIRATSVPVDHADPLIRQIEHLADVVRGTATPIVSGEDGLAAVAAVEAIKASANSGLPVRMPALD